jgi:hypothetical protein
MPEPLRRCLLLLAILVSGCTSQAADAPSLTPRSSASPSMTPSPTPDITGVPTPTPVPTPDPTSIELEVTGCEGGVVLNWSASTHPEFHHYTALRSPDGEIAPDYPPIAPAVDWGDTYATDRFVTSAVDASIIPTPTRWNYRVIAYDAQGRVVATSPVGSASLGDIADLGSMRVVPGPDGATTLSWRAYAGLEGCFSSYRVLYGIGGSPSTVLTVVSDQSVDSINTDELRSGTTYQLRVQAVRTTTLGGFVIGRTQTTTYTVP